MYVYMYVCMYVYMYAYKSSCLISVVRLAILNEQA